MEEERRNEYEAGPKKKGMSAGAKAVLIICIVLAALALAFTGIIIFVTVKNISSISSSQPELSQDFYDYGSSYGCRNGSAMCHRPFHTVV